MHVTLTGQKKFYCLFQISEGFMEHESLRLMAECVGVEISQLPPQAKKIHQLCKGNVSSYTTETVLYCPSFLLI